MAARGMKVRCLSSPCRPVSAPRFSHPFRHYASATPEPSATESHSRQPSNSSFRDRLDAGPGFADFITSSSSLEHAVLPENIPGARTVMVGPKGKQKQITRLPEWLKTPMPNGENFRKIKNDLRGLNLHTGMQPTHLSLPTIFLTEHCISLRRSALSKYIRLLGRIIQILGDSNHHAHGGYMHTRMSILLRQNIPSTTTS